MAVELMAEQDGAVFLPVVVGSVQWETWMSGSPGRLTFTVLEEEGFPALREGCRISLRLDGTLLFCGYVFTRVQEGRRFVSVTAYDQLRYLLSRDTLLYRGHDGFRPSAHDGGRLPPCARRGGRDGLCDCPGGGERTPCCGI